MPVYSNLDLEYSDLRLGHTVREHRKRRGWTLQELASRLSLSTASLSAIENDKVVLDIERLFAIAEAFEIRADAMLPRNPSRHFHISRSATPEAAYSPVTLRNEGHGKTRAYHNLVRPLADVFAGKHIEPFAIEIFPVADDQARFVSHHHEEFFFVQRGEIEFQAKTPEGVVREQLGMGDSVYFRSNLPHCIRCATPGKVAHAVHVIHSPYSTADSDRGDIPVYSNSGAELTLSGRVGKQFAGLRQAHGMSTADFAHELKVSVRMLAEIEHGRKPASIDLLLLACRRFRKPLDYFLSQTIIERPFYYLQRASEIKHLPVRARRRLVDAGWAENEFRSLASGFGPRGMYPYYVKIGDPRRHGLNLTLHTHHGQEFIYVLNGEVTLITVLDGKRVTETLAAGDTCLIDSAVPHRFIGMGLSPYDQSSAEMIDVYWCPLGESYLFDDDALADPAANHFENSQKDARENPQQDGDTVVHDSVCS